MHVCMYAQTHTHTHTYIQTYMNVHTYIHTYIHTDRQTDRHTDTQTHRHTHLATHVSLDMKASERWCVCVCVRERERERGSRTSSVEAASWQQKAEEHHRRQQQTRPAPGAHLAGHRAGRGTREVSADCVQTKSNCLFGVIPAGTPGPPSMRNGRVRAQRRWESRGACRASGVQVPRARGMARTPGRKMRHMCVRRARRARAAQTRTRAARSCRAARATTHGAAHTAPFLAPGDPRPRARRSLLPRPPDPARDTCATASSCCSYGTRTPQVHGCAPLPCAARRRRCLR